MQQLNVLPVNVSQNVDTFEESSAISATKNSEDFSLFMDKHIAKDLNSKGDTSSQAKTKSNDTVNESPIAKQTKSVNEGDGKVSTANKDDSATSDSPSENPTQQDVAASGKNGQSSSDTNQDESGLIASEQLMSFLFKADSTLVAESEQTSQQIKVPSESLTPEQKAQYQAQLLLKGENIKGSGLVADLSEVAKALTSEQQAQIAIAKGMDKNTLQNSAGSSVSAEHVLADKGIGKMPVDPIKNDLLATNASKTAEKALSEQLADYQGDKSASKSLSGDLVSSGNSNSKASLEQTKQQILAGDNLTDVKSAAKLSQSEQNEADVALNLKTAASSTTTEQGKAKTLADEFNSKVAALSSKEKSANELLLETKHTQSGEKVKLDAQSQFTDASSALNKKIAELAQAKEQNNKASEAAKSEVNAKATFASQLKSGELNQVEGSNSQENNKQVSANSQDLLKRTGAPITSANNGEHKVNQSTQSAQNIQNLNNAVTQETSEQAQTNAPDKKLSAEDASLKTDQLANEVIETDEKQAKPGKTDFSATTNFINVNANATQVTQQAIEMQSAEVLSPTVPVEAVQSQKTNAQLHQETIAIFRKDFADAVKDKVMLMISQKLQRFDITLDPPELGNMQVRVNLQSEQATVNFVVQNQQAKEALEQNMHKLRDMLAGQGVDVGDANVEQQSQQSENENGSSDGSHNQDDNIAMAGDLVEQTLSAKMVNASMNAVDYYA